MSPRPSTSRFSSGGIYSSNAHSLGWEELGTAAEDLARKERIEREVENAFRM